GPATATTSSPTPRCGSRTSSCRKSWRRRRAPASTPPRPPTRLRTPRSAGGSSPLGPRAKLGTDRGEALPPKKPHAPVEDRLPFGEVVVVMSPVPVLVGVLELVEGGVLGIQELPIPL